VRRVLGSRCRVTRSVAVSRSLAGSRSLVGKFRDPLGHSTWRAHGYVRFTQPSGQDGAAVAHAPVIRVCRAARAMTGAPVPGKRSAPRLHRGADGRIELVHRLVSRRRHPLPPLAQRGRSGLPGSGELPSWVVRVTSHDRIFSPDGNCGQCGAGFGVSSHGTDGEGHGQGALMVATGLAGLAPVRAAMEAGRVAETGATLLDIPIIC